MSTSQVTSFVSYGANTRKHVAHAQQADSSTCNKTMWPTVWITIGLIASCLWSLWP